MKHGKKKAAILTTASSLVVAAATSFSSGNLIEGGVLLAMAAGMFGLYEFYQVKQIPVSAEDLEGAADVAADQIDEQVDQYQARSSSNDSSE